jgi:guanylate kinase
MDKKIVLIGKSCSGKSTLAMMLKEAGLNPQISTTSRPKREYEKEGVDYFYIIREKFDAMNANSEFVEADIFTEWCYGLTWDELNKADILILTPRGLSKYLELFNRDKFLIIYIETSIKLRKHRITTRGDVHDDVSRRWVADDVDFEGVGDWSGPWDLKISINDNDAITNFINLIKAKINS